MNRSELRTWLSSVAFLDVVGFSKRSIQEQLEIKQHLDSVMCQQLSRIPQEDYIFLDRGDGAAVCFLVEPETAFFFALHVRDELALSKVQRPDYEIRVGINLGPIKIIRDVNGDRAPVGEGVNCAARVMDFAGPNEVLVARSFYDVIGCQSQEYAALFSYLGVRADKHVREFELYEVVAPGVLVPSQEVAAAAEARAAATRVAPVNNFEASFLNRIRRALARAIGPMADVLLSRAIKHADTEQDLVDCLGNAIHDTEQREAFLSLAGVSSNPSKAAPPTSVSQDSKPPSAAGLEAPELLDLARQELVKSLGPIAPVLVKQAAASAHDPAEFIDRLAEKVANSKARERFLAVMHNAASLSSD